MAPDKREIYVRTEEQLRAISNLTRHRILDVLRQGEATTTHVAALMGIAKGSASYHLRVLERAGFIAIVRTQPVRGVVEKYYAPAAERIELPDPPAGTPDVLMRNAVADLEATSHQRRHTVGLTHARLTVEHVRELAARLDALVGEYAGRRDPDGEPTTLALALFQPDAHHRLDVPSADEETTVEA